MISVFVNKINQKINLTDMGANTSQDSQRFIANFQQQYALVKDTNDARFGEVQVYRNKTGREMIMLKSVWSQNEHDFK